MARYYRGEEGKVEFETASGDTVAAIGTTGWSLEVTKETLECTKLLDQSREYIAGLVSGSGSIECTFDSTDTNQIALLKEAAEEATSANDPTGSTGASFKLYLSAANSHIAFKGIITGTSFGATVGELQTASVSFITSGAITVTLASD